MLDSLGLGYIWGNQDTFKNIPFSAIKQRILDTANQELIMSINTATKLQTITKTRLFKYIKNLTSSN